MEYEEYRKLENGDTVAINGEKQEVSTFNKATYPMWDMGLSEILSDNFTLIKKRKRRIQMELDERNKLLSALDIMSENEEEYRLSKTERKAIRSLHKKINN